MVLGEEVTTGVVAMVGPPNAGKSTLLNKLLGQKISIVSHRPQTTRNRIAGIVNGAGHQIVVLDTPGLHCSEKIFNLEMIRIAMESLAGVDLVLFLVDAVRDTPQKVLAGGGDEVVRALAAGATPALLVLNKIDLLAAGALPGLMEKYLEMYPFAAIVPVSALDGTNTGRLLDEIKSRLPRGPRLYPEDIPTELTERFIVAEIIREKIFSLTGQEVPYSTAVAVDSFKEDQSRGLVTIHATIFVEKDSQKPILIGRKGAMLTRIGREARLDIEELLDQRVLLKLWIKVQKNWTRDRRFLKELGF